MQTQSGESDWRSTAYARWPSPGAQMMEGVLTTDPRRARLTLLCIACLLLALVAVLAVNIAATVTRPPPRMAAPSISTGAIPDAVANTWHAAQPDSLSYWSERSNQ